MKSTNSLAPPGSESGFTLVEIMVVVVVIGLIAMLALPAFSRVRRASQNTRFISDLRTFAQAFESYAAMNGAWPTSASSGSVPAEMSAEFKTAAWSTASNSVGGRWNWDSSMSAPVAAIATTGVTVADTQMVQIDRRIDDGDLSTGLFQKAGARFIYVLQQ